MTTTKRIITAISVMLVVLLIAPLVVLNFANPMDGMGWMFLLFFGVNPVASIFVGILSGASVKKLWWTSLLFGIIFLLCCWFALQEIVLDLVVYAVIYLLLGMIAMLVTKVLCGLKAKNDEQS